MAVTGPQITVLGLGRMGSAIASRLADAGFAVTGWSRSGKAVDGIAAEADPAHAVRDADVVILALYDATACRAVLDLCLDFVPSQAVIVNTATVSSADAESLAATASSRGRSLAHCPVIGSTPAVHRGSLTLLLGTAEVPPGCGGVFATLGSVVLARDPATAAALKLVANGVLADGVVALGAALGRGNRLGLPRDPLLDVLERTALGGLASAKRATLEGRGTGSDFTAGALIKDVTMLAAIDTVSAHLPESLSSAGVASDADIAAIALALAGDAGTVIDRNSSLHAAPGLSRDPDLLEPLIAYARGHATGNAAHFREAFRPTAHVEGLREGEFVSWDLDAYCANFSGRPVDDEGSRVRRLTHLRRSGTVATAEMVLEHGPVTFTDQFVLVEEKGRWRIANKVYHRG